MSSASRIRGPGNRRRPPAEPGGPSGRSQSARVGFARRLDAWSDLLERRFGRYGAGLLIAVLLLAIAAVYVTPALQAVNHGVNYRALAVSPFDFKTSNDVRLRILTPLVAHYLFLRGDAYIVLPLLIGVLFLAAIYVHYRRQGYRGVEAAGIAALMAFTTPILFALHFQGYTDTTSYLLLFLTLVSLDRHWLWPVFYALALLNHEGNLFAAPMLLLAANRNGLRLSRTAVIVALLAAAIVPLALYRHYVQLHGHVQYNLDYYLNWKRLKDSIVFVGQLLPLGVFMAFKLAWSLPLTALADCLGKRRVLDGAFFVGTFLCAAAQLALASDTSRLLTLAFPAVLYGAEVVRERWGQEFFARRLWILIGLNFLVPQYYIGQWYAIPFFPLPVSLVLQHVFGVDAWKLWWS
jgi:hypothetical protein